MNNQRPADETALLDQIASADTLTVPTFIANMLNEQGIVFHQNPEAYENASEIFIRTILKALEEGAVTFENTVLGRVANSATTAFIAATLDVLSKGVVRTIPEDQTEDPDDDNPNLSDFY